MYINTHLTIVCQYAKNIEEANNIVTCTLKLMLNTKHIKLRQNRQLYSK